MPEILGDVRALAYVERWAKKEKVWAKSAFCGKKLNLLGKFVLYMWKGSCILCNQFAWQP